MFDFNFSLWQWLIAIYLILAIGTLLPTLFAFFKQDEPFEKGSNYFQESTYFSDAAKERLARHNDRMLGALGFWKKQAKQYRRFHYYIIIWVVVSATLLPIMTQAITPADPFSKWFLTIMSTHTALLLGFHRVLKVDENFRDFRNGESRFYDLRRRMLDRPYTLGANEKEAIDNYIGQVERIRQALRKDEVGNIPILEEATAGFTDTNRNDGFSRGRSASTSLPSGDSSAGPH